MISSTMIYTNNLLYTSVIQKYKQNKILVIILQKAVIYRLRFGRFIFSSKESVKLSK